MTVYDIFFSKILNFTLEATGRATVVKKVNLGVVARVKYLGFNDSNLEIIDFISLIGFKNSILRSNYII